MERLEYSKPLYTRYDKPWQVLKAEMEYDWVVTVAGLSEGKQAIVLREGKEKKDTKESLEKNV